MPCVMLFRQRPYMEAFKHLMHPNANMELWDPIDTITHWNQLWSSCFMTENHLYLNTKFSVSKGNIAQLNPARFLI